MNSFLRRSLLGLVLICSPLLFMGCTIPCGCPPPPPYEISGRLTDSLGVPLAGVSIGAVILLQPYTAEQSHLGLIVYNGGTHSDHDGRYTLHVDSRPIRLLSQPRVGSVLYEMKISPELHLDDSKPSVSGVDFAFNPIPTSAIIKGMVTPMRTSAQTDTVTLSQILTIDGNDYAKWWAQQDPTLSGSEEIFQFPLQPGGVYSLSLHRYEANNQLSGEAIATLALPEGGSAEVHLTVK